MENQDALDHAVERLQKQGYAGQFELKFDTLVDLHDERLYHVSDFDIEEVHRFEKDTDKELSFVLAIRTKDDRKGILVEAYGKHSDPISIEMLEKFELKNISRKP